MTINRYRLSNEDLHHDSTAQLYFLKLRYVTSELYNKCIICYQTNTICGWSRRFIICHFVKNWRRKVFPGRRSLGQHIRRCQGNYSFRASLPWLIILGSFAVFLFCFEVFFFLILDFFSQDLVRQMLHVNPRLRLTAKQVTGFHFRQSMLIAVITVEPADKISFVYNCM